MALGGSPRRALRPAAPAGAAAHAHGPVRPARVVRPGGRVVAEFYNASSIRALVKRLGPSGDIGASGDTDESDVFTRFDTLADIEGYLPPTLKLDRVDGIRVLTPMAGMFKVPGWASVERLAMKTPLRRVGGFLVVTLERLDG